MTDVQGSRGLISVRKVKHGEKIGEPGVYDVPMGWYHADCCVGPSISSSGLRKIRQYSPLHYFDTCPYNPARADDEETVDSAAIRMGSAAHTLLLEPELFAERYLTRPGMWDSWRTKEARAWRLDAMSAGKTVLDGSEMQTVVGIANALRSHPLHGLGILDGDIERALIWQDEKTGVWLKSRPDVIPRGSNIFTDLKCLRDARSRHLSKAVFESGYDMQMALAGIGMKTLLGRDIEEYVLVVVENKRPHAVTIRPIDLADIERASLLLRWSINKFAECIASGKWPSFEEDDNTHIRRLPWETKDIETQIEMGLLPQEY